MMYFVFAKTSHHKKIFEARAVTELNWKKNTALFVGGQAVTLIGSMVVQYAIFWHITLETKSGAMMTVYTVVGLLPMFFISPFGGVWADRYNRKFVINAADGVVALASLAVAVTIMLGHMNYAILLMCAAVRSLGQGVQMPASGAVIPQIVPEKYLTKVNGIQSSVNSFCYIASPMLGGLLMMYLPLETLFFLDVATAIIGISILQFLVKIPDVKKSCALDNAAVSSYIDMTVNNNAVMTVDNNVNNNAVNNNADIIVNKNVNTTHAKKRAGYFDDLRGGLRYIRGHGFVLRLILFTVIFTVFMTPLALLTPLQTVRNFGDEIWRLTAIEIAFASGMILGGLIIAAWGGFKNRIHTMALASFFIGVTAFALGVTPIFWLYIGIMALGGITAPFFDTPVRVMLQSNVEPEYMGRVMSVFTMISSSMMPLAMLFFGPIADAVNINTIMIITGVIMALLSFSLLTSKTFRRIGAG